jgi:hypothetical protein
MKKIDNLIIGSGIGGLALGAEFTKNNLEFLIADKNQSIPKNLHNGIHYLHTDKLNLPFECELKEITSTEEIWNPRKDEFKKCAHLPEMVDYSIKVMGLRHPSSIMDPGSRPWKTFVPISNNMNDLLDSFENYIGAENFLWERKLIAIDAENKIATFDWNQREEKIQYENLITTAPLTVTAKLLNLEHPELKFQTLHITNYKTENIVANWLISLYISDDLFPVYRVTHLNNILSMESLKPLTEYEEHIIHYHLSRYFQYDTKTKETYSWESGRIWGISKEQRRKILEKVIEKDIIPIGRYGLWNGKLEMSATVEQAQIVVKSIKEIGGLENKYNKQNLINSLS